MLQFIPGTDFICSGYSAVPQRDNLFGGGNFDAEDFDDYNVLQRDMQVDGGVRPVTEDEVTGDPEASGAQAIQAVYAELGLPGDHATTRSRRRRRRTAATTCPSATLVADLAAADRFLASDQGMLDVADALRRSAASQDVAANVLEMGRQRRGGATICSRAAHLSIAAGLSRPQRHQRRERLRRARHRLSPGGRAVGEAPGDPPGAIAARRSSPPHVGTPSPKLVEIGPMRSPARGPRSSSRWGRRSARRSTRTIGGLEHEEVLAAILTGRGGRRG